MIFYGGKSSMISAERDCAMGVLAYNLLHILRQCRLADEKVKRSMEWLIKRLIKVGAKVAYNGQRWQVHVASAFSLVGHYGTVFG